MKTAVVLFNLGGPDGPAAVRPFLTNLFEDPAILRAPGFLRSPLARWIARRRTPEATRIYAELGGASPILEETRAQAEALQGVLDRRGEYRVFVAMRHWHPFSEAAARDVARYAPDRVRLLPLYPQFSTTTTASALDAWRRAARAAKIDAPTTAVCCYPTDEAFVSAQAETLAEATSRCVLASGGRKPRVLFSAHGLPRRIVDGGDPYQWQVERTAAAVAGKAAVEAGSWVVCYQSRVGPLRWIGPETAAEIERAGAEGLPVVVVPVTFVSEHSETLVELDVRYRRVAESAGVPAYERAAAVRTHPGFVEGLAALAAGPQGEDAGSAGPVRRVRSATGGRTCPGAFVRCAMAAAGEGGGA